MDGLMPPSLGGGDSSHLLEEPEPLHDVRISEPLLRTAHIEERASLWMD